MKNIFLIILFIFVHNIFAMSFSEEWTTENGLNLKVSCQANELRYCMELCPGTSDVFSCNIPQTICRDCIGTSLKVTDIFENMGTKYKNKGQEVNYYSFIDFIKSKKFVTFSSQSIFNHVESYDADVLQQKFKSLCPASTQSRPLVFFSLLEKSKRLDQVVYVTCDSEIFEMTLEDIIQDSF